MTQRMDPQKEQQNSNTNGTTKENDFCGRAVFHTLWKRGEVILCFIYILFTAIGYAVSSANSSSRADVQFSILTVTSG